MKTLFILLLTITGCGGLPVGQDGVDGRSPKCSVEKRGEQTFLKCINPDGTAAEAEIGNSDETPSVSNFAQCSYASEVYSARYNVLSLGEDKRIASLAVTNLKTPKVFYQGSILHALGDEGFDSAEIKLSAWSAKMVGDKKAEITQVGGNPEAILCK